MIGIHWYIHTNVSMAISGTDSLGVRYIRLMISSYVRQYPHNMVYMVHYSILGSWNSHLPVMALYQVSVPVKPNFWNASSHWNSPFLGHEGPCHIYIYIYTYLQIHIYWYVLILNHTWLTTNKNHNDISIFKTILAHCRD